MDYFGNPANLQLLQNLLKEPEGQSSDSEPDDRVPVSSVKISSANSTAGLQGTSEDKERVKTDLKQKDSLETTQRLRNPPQNLTEWEYQEAYLNDSELDDRLIPEYRIIYKQSVAPEDIYLQMGNRTTATSSCEEMCLEIEMPQETVSIDRMKLDVTSDEIDLQTPVYRLKLPLVQKIDPDHGKANWDGRAKILHLNLRMKREYDFINF